MHYWFIAEVVYSHKMASKASKTKADHSSAIAELGTIAGDPAAGIDEGVNEGAMGASGAGVVTGVATGTEEGARLEGAPD